MRRIVLALLPPLLALTACTSVPSESTDSAVPAVPASTSEAIARSTRAPGTVTSTASSGSSPTPSVESAHSPRAPTTEQPTTGFTGTVDEIDPGLTARMASSWRAGCPVPLADLRYLTLTHRGFDGAEHQGELVVAATVADDVVAIFRRLYQDGYPIESMRLVDDFGGDDNASMSANNTSAFNCRPVTGGAGFSEHSYGTAVDVNPLQNPYVSGSTVLPAAGLAYVDRPNSPGVIHDGDEAVRAFTGHGFSWGGAWPGPIDYQHFSLSGR